MKLLIVIVNYRTPALTVDCLASLAPEVQALSAGTTGWTTGGKSGGESSAVKVVVVENASGDDSANVLRQAIDAHGWQGWASLQVLDKNLGFAGGNNAAIRPAVAADRPVHTQPNYVLLLNPDTVVRPGALQTLLRFMEDHPQAGIAGSRLENPDGSPQCSAFRFPTFWGEVNSGFKLGILTKLLNRYVIAPPERLQTFATDWVSGACFMIRKTVLEEIGLLDEGYFMYYEEVDFCLRARRAGWECWYVPAARVVHLVGQSSGVSSSQGRSKPLPRYWFDSRRRYFQKNHGRGYALITELAWILGHLTWCLRSRLQLKTTRPTPGLVRDSLQYIVWPLVKAKV